MAATTDEHVAKGEPAQAGGQSPSPDPNQSPSQVADQEWLRNYIAEQHGEGAGQTAIEVPKKKSPALKIALVLALAVAGAAMYLAKNGDLLSLTGPKSGAEDLGQGVSTATGLRGHMVTVWDGKAQYRLKIEPIDPRDDSDFWRVTQNTPQPLFINIRLLSKEGDVLCGKQVELTANSGKGAGAAAASGADTFQRLPLKRDRDIDGLWAQGSLPCSGDQYKQFDYWDFTTNFPAVAQQDDIPEPKVAAPQAQDESAETPRDVHETAVAPVRTIRRKIAKKPQSLFYMEGDDHATAFEPGRNLLTIGPGKTFVLLRANDAATAAGWANDSLLIHYMCDQHANCTLRRPGSPLVFARMD